MAMPVKPEHVAIKTGRRPTCARFLTVIEYAYLL